MHISHTIRAIIEISEAHASFLALETRLQNEIGIYLFSTMLVPGGMSARSVARALFSKFLPLLACMKYQMTFVPG
jgi:hypothetical protein